MPFGNQPGFSGRVPVQFLSADKPSLNISGSNVLFNNPEVFTVEVGNVAKSVQLLNGTNAITGQGEVPPLALAIEWAQMGYNDYLSLSNLQPYNLTFISHRNLGYYGRMVLSGPSNAKSYTSDVVKATATFFVINPDDTGGAATVNRIATPTTFSGATAVGNGFIQSSLTLHYWLTFHTKFGETTPQHISVTTGGTGSAVNTLTWTWPVSTNYCTYASIYVATVNDPTQSKLMAEVLNNGASAVWNDLVGFAGVSQPGAALYQQPPSANTAFRGGWQGGIWVNEP